MVPTGPVFFPTQVGGVPRPKVASRFGYQTSGINHPTEVSPEVYTGARGTP